MSDVFPGVPASGTPGSIGNYQHHTYRYDSTGKLQFFVAGWFNSDGSWTRVPPSYCTPGANAALINAPARQIVQNGTLPDGTSAQTFWDFDNMIGFVDSHKEAKPTVVFDSSGTLVSPGYSHATGHWVIGNDNGTEIVGISPNDTTAILAAVSQAWAAMDLITSLVTGRP